MDSAKPSWFLVTTDDKAKLRDDRQPAVVPNDVWAMDFVHDQLATGKKIRVLTAVDTFSRYVPVLDPRFSYRAENVVRALEQVCPRIGYPSVGQAIAAADAYMADKLNPTIHADRAELIKDGLGVGAWHEERAARAAQDQEATLGAIIVKNRQVKVERRSPKI